MKESQLEAVTRAVLGHILDELEEGDDVASVLRQLSSPGRTLPRWILGKIEDASKAWQRESGVLELKHRDLFWAVRARREDPEGSDPRVFLEWGWDPETPERVMTTPEHAVQLGRDLLALYTDPETGELSIPVLKRRSDNEERWSWPTVPGMDPELLDEYWEAVGDKVAARVSDLNLWARLDKPKPVPRHDWEKVSEDGVAVCSSCGHWYYLDERRADYPTEVCPGPELRDPVAKNIRDFDPRRSTRLREAQRMDRLLALIQLNGGSDLERSWFSTMMQMSVNLLKEEDLARFKKERLSQPETSPAEVETEDA